MDDFKKAAASDLFGDGNEQQAVEDAFALLRVFGTERNWSTPAPLTTPSLVRARAERGQLKPEQRAAYRQSLEQMGQISAKHADATQPAKRELRQISAWLVKQWNADDLRMLEPDAGATRAK